MEKQFYSVVVQAKQDVNTYSGVKNIVVAEYVAYFAENYMSALLKSDVFVDSGNIPESFKNFVLDNPTTKDAEFSVIIRFN
jgi:hypothetical protein